MALGLGSRRSRRNEAGGRREGIHRMGDFEGVYRACRFEERLGRGSDRNKVFDLCEPELSRRGCVRGCRIEGNSLGEPEQLDAEPGGVQFAAIPEFQMIGIALGQQMTDALADNITVEEALANSQEAADR